MGIQNAGQEEIRGQRCVDLSSAFIERLLGMEVEGRERELQGFQELKK